jgi:hypothetical protein
VFGGRVAVALELAMTDSREQIRVHSEMFAGLASEVVASLLIVYSLDHPYNRASVRSSRPRCARRW